MRILRIAAFFVKSKNLGKNIYQFQFIAQYEQITCKMNIRQSKGTIGCF